MAIKVRLRLQILLIDYKRLKVRLRLQSLLKDYKRLQKLNLDCKAWTYTMKLGLGLEGHPKSA